MFSMQLEDKENHGKNYSDFLYLMAFKEVAVFYFREVIMRSTCKVLNY